MKTTRILAAAAAFPEKRITNSDLERMVDTDDNWIVERTGVRERRVVKPGQAASHLATEATHKLFKKIDRSPEDIDAILVATVTPDMQFPSTACLVQENIGAKNAWCLDLNAACSGFIYALSVADQFIKTGKCKNVLLIGVDVMSSITDYQDRTTCILFGDAAGAVYIEAAEEKTDAGIIDTRLYADGAGQHHLYMEAGGSLKPATNQTIESRLHYIRQDGRNVFKAAVTCMAKVTDEIIQANQVEPKEIDLFVAHQANLRIIDACAKRLKLPKEKVVVNIDRYGNTTAATIPSCLAEVQENGRLQPGMLLLMAAFGAGYTYGSALVRWG